MARWNAIEHKERLREWFKRAESDLSPPDLQKAGLRTAFDRLQTGEVADPEQAESLEALVLSYGRPAVPVGEGSIEFESPWKERLSEVAKQILVSACAAVGRLESSAVDVPGYAGTAFLVSPDLVMTTRHVAELFATGVGVRDLRFKAGRPLRIDFGNGGDYDRVREYPIAAVTMIHPYLDIALMRLMEPTSLPQLELWAEDPGTLEGHDIAVIAYPQFDQRYGVELQKLLLGEFPGVKRVMLGKVMTPRLQSTLGRQMLALTHDAITLGGTAGSPVIDLTTGRAVAVSFASVYLDANYAVPMSELAQDPHLWEAGLQFAGRTKTSTSPWQEYWSEIEPEVPATASVEQADTTPLSLPSVRSAVELLVTEHFSDPALFRKFLTEHDYHEVVRAIPERADSMELVRALDRRSLLDRAFLQALTEAAPTAAKPGGPEGLSPWLPQSMLSRVTWALEPVSPEMLEVYAVGSPWRDDILGPDGKPESASAAVQRLAYDTRPNIHEVLAWLLRRLYESLKTDEQERVDALYEAVQHLEGGPKDDASNVPDTKTWASTPAMQTIAYLEEGLRAARSVALVQLSREQGATPYGSTGWLLTPDIVVVAAHLLAMTAGSSTGFSTERENERAQTGVVHFDFDVAGKQTIEHKIQGVVLSDLYLDIALLRLVVPVQDRAPLRIRPEPLPQNLSGLATIHHPHLGPKQISRDGRLLRANGSDVLYLLDTAPGSAGAPIFDDDWRVIAVHRAYSSYRVAPDQPPIPGKLGTSTAALLARLRDREGNEAVWREVVAAQPTLKSLNVNVAAYFNETEKLPVVLRLLDSTPLGDVPGFHITSQSGDMVTGLCDGSGLKALTEHPKVIAIDLSKPAGELECAISVPHIGAMVIHAAPYNEKGEQALIGLIDSGIDVRHRAFSDDQGKTRILAFWDQHDARSPAGDPLALAVAQSPKGEEWVRKFELGYGALYLSEDIDGFVSGTPLPPTFPSPVEMEHGTVTAGIAAGRRTGDTEDHFAGGVAPAAKLLVVRYDLQSSSVGYSKGHIDALNFIARVADVEKLPVVVNISNGMNAGAHDGTSPVERRCNNFTDQGQAPGRIIVKSAGNERGLGHHAMVSVPQGVTKFLRWRSHNWPGRAPGTSPEEVEIWFHHLNNYRFELQPPEGSLSPPINSEHPELKEYLSNGNYVSALLTPYRTENGGGFLNIKISKGENAEVKQGEWRLKITGIQIPQKAPLHAWVELMPDRNVFFQDYVEDHFTITIPGTAEHVIAVGAVEVSDYMAPFERSSWGPTRHGREKPDLMAPGVTVFGPGADRCDLRSLKADSGTSLAAPHVTGAIALALSACVKSGREPHSSFRIKAALQETARHGTQTWNEETGYGALDAEKFFINLQK